MERSNDTSLAILGEGTVLVTAYRWIHGRLGEHLATATVQIDDVTLAKRELVEKLISRGEDVGPYVHKVALVQGAAVDLYVQGRVDDVRVEVFSRSGVDGSVRWFSSERLDAEDLAAARGAWQDYMEEIR